MEKNELKIIKEGKTGHGILIENDGYIKLKDEKTIKEGIGDGEWYVPNPFVVDAVFQKFGVKNANGRIYPENVLKKQVELYQQKIDERRALGECYKPDALVLTENGWLRLENVKEGQNVLTLNVETMETEYFPIIRKIEKDFNGNLITLKTRKKYMREDIGINDSVTPKHKFPVFKKNEENGNFEYVDSFEAEELSSIQGYIPLNLRPYNHSFKASNGDELEFANIEDITFGTDEYNGKVMCIEVENHTWYVMCDGKCHWTNNCNHPAESTIDLSRISHNIIELHWEGRTLVGKMELNVTEGFRKQGIISSRGDEVANLLLNGYKIGVSSRGVGSVEQKLGQYVVGDDFELICWDVVSEPSTPNAFIAVHGEEELRPWVENDETKNFKTPINEKINKIKNILNS